MSCSSTSSVTRSCSSTSRASRFETLKEIVRGTEQFRIAEAEGKLLRLPTGDGGALVFRTTPEAPVLCALEIAKALKNHPELQVRMGIHSGPVNEVTDLNEQANIAGAGINIAQRVMDCGDAGHILLSTARGRRSQTLRRWRPYLHEIGECKVKHGEIISLVNFYTEELGNPQRPQNIRGAAPAKSVAVLPFVNMSADKHDEYLSDGMTEELINALAKVPGLRVPGRTSCFAFKGKNEEDIFRKVGDQLHVDTVLEGSVRKAGDKLRVTAQLINVSDGYHLWSEGLRRRRKRYFYLSEQRGPARCRSPANQVRCRSGACFGEKADREPGGSSPLFAGTL